MTKTMNLSLAELIQHPIGTLFYFHSFSSDDICVIVETKTVTEGTYSVTYSILTNPGEAKTQTYKYRSTDKEEEDTQDTARFALVPRKVILRMAAALNRAIEIKPKPRALKTGPQSDKPEGIVLTPQPPVDDPALRLLTQLIAEVQTTNTELRQIQVLIQGSSL
jgi:hypothetical protein